MTEEFLNNDILNKKAKIINIIAVVWNVNSIPNQELKEMIKNCYIKDFNNIVDFILKNYTFLSKNDQMF